MLHLGKHLEEIGQQPYLAPRLLGLCCRLGVLIATLGDRDRAALEIDVAETQRRQLAGTRPHVEQCEDQRMPGRFLDLEVLEDDVALLRGEGIRFVANDLRPSQAGEGIAEHDPLLLELFPRVAKERAEMPVDNVPDRFHTDRPFLAPNRAPAELSPELPEIADRDVLKRDVSSGRQDHGLEVDLMALGAVEGETSGGCCRSIHVS